MAEVDEVRQEARRNTRGRFEQWAKNPTCAANTLSAVHNIRLDAAAKAAGLDPELRSVAVRHRTREPVRGRAVLRRGREAPAALERKRCLPDGIRRASSTCGFEDERWLARSLGR